MGLHMADAVDNQAQAPKGQNLHGTMDVTLDPMAATGATGTVTLHIDMP
jgi:hypothetical protein